VSVLGRARVINNRDTILDYMYLKLITKEQNVCQFQNLLKVNVSIVRIK